MNRPRAATPAALAGSASPLDRAIGYTLGSLRLATTAALSRPTPCREWDLCTLLAHIDDSVAAFHDAIALGRVGLVAGLGEAAVGDAAGRATQPDSATPGAGPTAWGGGPAAGLRRRAIRLLGVCAGVGDGPISVGGCLIPASTVIGVAAVEIAVHGWDVARACGLQRPIPPELASDLLRLVPQFVTDADRPARFAARVAVPHHASPGTRLLAFLGRDADRASD